MRCASLLETVRGKSGIGRVVGPYGNWDGRRFPHFAIRCNRRTIKVVRVLCRATAGPVASLACLPYWRRGRCPVSVRINWVLHVRLTLANKRELKPFANIPGIRSLGNELSSEPLDEQKYLFPDSVDKHHVRKIDN